MKNAPKPNLGKFLAQNEKVTVRTTFDKIRYWKASPEVQAERDRALDPTVIRGRVCRPSRRGALVKLSFADGGFVYERIFRADEGTVWVRGWDTEEALAMIVAEGLR